MLQVSRSEQTARTLVLVGLILDAVGFVALLGVALALLTYLVFPLLDGFLFLGGVLSLVWLVLVYTISYSRIRDGDLEEARTPTLVFAILSLITGGIVPGILYLIAYLMLGQALDQVDAQRTSTPPTAFPPAAPLFGGSSPMTGPAPPRAAAVCPKCGRLRDSPDRFCRNCGAPLS